MFTAVVSASGAIRCWGYNQQGQCNVPSDLEPAIMVSAGTVHAVALTMNGVVRCWGGNWFGQASEQQDLSGVSWIVAGGSHTIAIERDCYQTCTASVSGNCIVDGADLAPLLAYWGPVNDSTASSVCDINVDGRVDGFDLGVLLNNWGPCPN
jgi:hypothetical protein